MKRHSLLLADELVPTVRGILITIFAAALLLAAMTVTQGHTSITTLAVVDTICFGALWLGLRFIGPNAAILGATICLLLSTMYSMAIGRGLNDVAIVILPTVIFVGALLLNRSQFVLSTAAAVLGVLAFGIAQKNGLLVPPESAALDYIDIVAPAIVLGAVGVLSALLMGALRRSMSRAAASERNYREIFNATHEAILIHDARTGRIVDVNDTMLSMYGYAREEALRLTTGDISAGLPEYGQERALALLSRAYREGPQTFEWLARKKDGSRFWIEATLRSTEIGGRERILAVVRDISERKRAADQLRHAEKMEAIGQLAGGVAHDFNNQLAGLMGYVELLLNRTHDPEAVERYAKGILSSAERARDLTSKLLIFARRGQPPHVLVDLHAVVMEVVELLRRSIDPRIEIRLELGAARVTAIGDQAQLQAVLLNLCLNARDAMPAGGVLTLRTGNVVIEDDARERFGGVKPGEYLTVEVADTGHGMGDDVRTRIFEPFFTTKEAGTGMGLAAVYGTLERHQGGIEVESAPGRGSVFRFWLPVISAESTAVLDGRPVAALRPGLRILLAEDEPDVAAAMVELLRTLGCEVTHCKDGLETTETYRRSPREFDVVLLDLVMPKQGGADALHAIRVIRPDAVVVLVSGYEADADVARLLEQGASAFLRKPYRLQELSEILLRVTENPSSTPS